MATREDALRLLESAGIENLDTGTPLDRAEITRRFMDACALAFNIPDFPAGYIVWPMPITDDEDAWSSIDDQLVAGLGTTFVWPETMPTTFGAVVMEIERQFRHLWKRTVTDYEANPRHCGTQAAFYGIRNILRSLYQDEKARWRPSTLIAEVLPLDKRAPFERRIGEEYGIRLPTELRVFGQVPFMTAWWVAWLLSLLLIIGAQIPGGWFLVGVIVLVTAIITIGLMSLSRYVWSDSLYNLGDIACHIVREQAKLRESLKEATEISAPDSD